MLTVVEPVAARGAGNPEERALMEEFSDLLCETATQFTTQFEAARSEIVRMEGLLCTAADDLVQSFHGIHAQAEAQRQLALAVMNGCAGGAADRLDALGASAIAVETLVGRAVTALQFQDIVSQLLGHIARRVDALDYVMRQFNVLGATLDREAASDDARGAIASLRAEQGRIAAALKGIEAQTLNNPVDQRVMTQGDIELF